MKLPDFLKQCETLKSDKEFPARIFMDEYYIRKPGRLCERMDDTWCPEYEANETKNQEYVHINEHNEILKQHRTLLEIIEIQREALEFYSNQRNWCFMELEDNLDDYEKLDSGRPIITGGKRARSAEAAVEKLIGGMKE